MGAAAVSTALFACLEAAEAAEMAWPSHITGLKPGANEKKTVQTILKTQPENFAKIKNALDRILRPEYYFSHEPDEPQNQWPTWMLDCLGV